MQNGVVATITVTMTTSALSASVGLTNPVATIAAGGPISVTGTGGTRTVPLPTLTGLSCSPTSLSRGASSTCTVSLNEPASASGAVVALSSTTSDRISACLGYRAGRSCVDANFTATAGTIASNLTAGITGTLNGSSQTAYVSLLAPTTVSLVSCNPASLSRVEHLLAQ